MSSPLCYRSACLSPDSRSTFLIRQLCHLFLPPQEGSSRAAFKDRPQLLLRKKEGKMIKKKLERSLCSNRTNIFCASKKKGLLASLQEYLVVKQVPPDKTVFRTVPTSLRLLLIPLIWNGVISPDRNCDRVPLSGQRSLLTVTGGVLSGDRNYDKPYLAATLMCRKWKFKSEEWKEVKGVGHSSAGSSGALWTGTRVSWGKNLTAQQQCRSSCDWKQTCWQRGIKAPGSPRIPT